MNKPLYMSTTLRGAAITVAAFFLQLFWNPSATRFEFRNLTPEEWGIVSTFILGAEETVRGRLKKEKEIQSLTVDIDTEESEILPILEVNKVPKAFLVAQQDTYLKNSIEQSSQLDSQEKSVLSKGTKIEVEGWSLLSEKNNHIEVVLGNNQTLFAYAPHFKLYGVSETEIDIERLSSNVEILRKNKTPITLPGYSTTFYLEDSIYPGSNFFWYEATKNGTRIPSSKGIVDNIISQAKHLDNLRKANGNRPLVVTSWYRDPITNAQVGGANRSDHLTGRSTDLFCPSMKILDFQKFCVSYWKLGGVGRGAPKGFVHLSSDQNYRIWDY